MSQSPSRHRLPLAVCLLRPRCHLSALLPCETRVSLSGQQSCWAFSFRGQHSTAPAASWPWLDSSKARMRTNDRDKACLCSHGNCRDVQRYLHLAAQGPHTGARCSHPMHIRRLWMAAALGSCSGPSQCHHWGFLNLLIPAPVFSVARHSPELPRKGDFSTVSPYVCN